MKYNISFFKYERFLCKIRNSFFRCTKRPANDKPATLKGKSKEAKMDQTATPEKANTPTTDKGKAGTKGVKKPDAKALDKTDGMDKDKEVKNN